MKYYVCFTLTTGDNIRFYLGDDCPEANLEANYDAVANEIISKPFWHYYDNGRLAIVNMRNVAYVTVYKAEGEE